MLQTKDNPAEVVEEPSELLSEIGEDGSELAAPEKKRELPLWAVILAVFSFLLFNAFFLAFAMQVSSGGGG